MDPIVITDPTLRAFARIINPTRVRLLLGSIWRVVTGDDPTLARPSAGTRYAQRLGEPFPGEAIVGAIERGDACQWPRSAAEWRRLIIARIAPSSAEAAIVRDGTAALVAGWAFPHSPDPSHERGEPIGSDACPCPTCERERTRERGRGEATGSSD